MLETENKMFGKKLTKQAVDNLISKGAKLYDVRDPVSFRDGTLPGATNLALRNVMSINKLDKKQKLIFYSKSADDVDLNMVMNYAHQFGFTDIYYILSTLT